MKAETNTNITLSMEWSPSLSPGNSDNLKKTLLVVAVVVLVLVVVAVWLFVRSQRLGEGDSVLLEEGQMISEEVGKELEALKGPAGNIPPAPEEMEIKIKELGGDSVVPPAPEDLQKRLEELSRKQ